MIRPLPWKITNVLLALARLEREIAIMIMHEASDWAKLKEVTSKHQPVIDEFFKTVDLHRNSKNVSISRMDHYTDDLVVFLDERTDEELETFMNKLRAFFDELDSVHQWYDMGLAPKQNKADGDVTDVDFEELT